MTQKIRMTDASELSVFNAASCYPLICFQGPMFVCKCYLLSPCVSWQFVFNASSCYPNYM